MAQTTTHTSLGSSVGALTTGLNSLANGSSVLTSGIDNTTNKNLYVDAFVKLALQGAARSAGARVDVYVLASPDGGTTYEDLIVGGQQLVGTISYDAATTARLGCARDCSIPPGFFKLAYVNNTGQAFAASGNTADAYPHSVLST